MVMVKIKGNEYYIERNVKLAMDYVKDRVLNNEDMFTGLVDGRHGTGKSTLTMQLAYYCSNGNLTLDNVVFSPEDFVKQLTNAKPGDNIILDEAFDTINRRTTLTRANMDVLSLMQKMRLKKIFVWVVLPYMYDLDKNVILGLGDLLFHCWRKDYGPRGKYWVYKRDRFTKLWLNCRSYYKYPFYIAKPNIMYARFPKFFPFNEKEYENKKLESFKTQAKKTRLETKYLKQRNVLVYQMVQEGIEKKIIAKKMGIQVKSIDKIIQRVRNRDETNPDWKSL